LAAGIIFPRLKKEEALGKAEDWFCQQEKNLQDLLVFW
jgi:hypothetical protein